MEEEKRGFKGKGIIEEGIKGIRKGEGKFWEKKERRGTGGGEREKERGRERVRER